MADPVPPLLAVSAVEALGAGAMAAGVAWAGLASDSSGVSGIAEFGMWIVLAGALALIWFGLYRRRRVARAPLLLVQAFGIVVAWTFLQSDDLSWRIVGLALMAVTSVGLVLGLRPSLNKALH